MQFNLIIKMVKKYKETRIDILLEKMMIGKNLLNVRFRKKYIIRMLNLLLTSLQESTRIKDSRLKIKKRIINSIKRRQLYLESLIRE